MASLIFGELDDPRWFVPPDNPRDARYAHDRVRYWNVHHRRLATPSPTAPRRTHGGATYRSDVLVPLDDVGNARRALENVGFIVEAATPAGLSFSGEVDRFREEFGFDPFRLAGRTVRAADGDNLPLLPNSVAAIEINPVAVPASPVTRRAVPGGLAASAVVACAGNPRTGPPVPRGYDLRADPIESLEGPLGLADIYEKGRGIRVAVVDTGFAFDEIGGAGERLDAVPPPTGLYETTDERGHGTAVLHHLLSTAPEVHARISKYTDHSGIRNYPVAAFQKAVYPEGHLGDPWPDIVLCSWVMADFSLALQREIAHAVSRGVVVIFAAGNGRMRDVPPAALPPSIGIFGDVNETKGLPFDQLVVEPRSRNQRRRQVHAVAQPDALVVGGAAPALRAVEASAVASSYASALYEGSKTVGHAARHVPEVCGLVAQAPPFGKLAGLHLTATARRSVLDEKPDGTGPTGGRVLTSGTSMAAAQIAGVVARLKERYPGLSPFAVRNVLMASATDVSAGTPGGPSPTPAIAGWDAGTGFGVVHADRALEWLVEGSSPYVRARLDDPGEPSRRVLTGRESSPDVFLRRRPFPDRVDQGIQPDEDLQVRWGLPLRHFRGLSQAPPKATPATAYLYVRVSNRGRDAATPELWVHRIDRRGRVGVTLKRTNHGPVPAVEAGGFLVVGPFPVEVRDSTQAFVVGLGVEALASSGTDDNELNTEIQNDLRLAVRWLGGDS